MNTTIVFASDVPADANGCTGTAQEIAWGNDTVLNQTQAYGIWQYPLNRLTRVEPFVHRSREGNGLAPDSTPRT